MAVTRHPQRRSTTRLVVVLVAGLLTLLPGLAAMAVTSISPGEVLADVDVTLTLRAPSDPIDLTTSLEAVLPPQIVALSCDAPSGWSCQSGSSQVTWRRGTSLAADEAFELTVHTPGTGGEYTFTLTQSRASGSQTTNRAGLLVSEPEPTEEPTIEPSDPATEEPSLPTSDDARLEPFRPPDGSESDPISIHDLPSDQAVDAGREADADRVIPRRNASVERLLALMVAALLLTSATGFVVARANR